MKPLVVIALVVGVGALSFFGGVQYQKAQVPSGFAGRTFSRTGSGQMQTGTSRRMGSGQPIMGEVMEIDDSSLTVKLPDGSSRIVLMSDKTILNKTASVEKSEIKKGEKVGVFGVTNTDGSIVAQSIQLNPQFRMGGVK